MKSTFLQNSLFAALVTVGVAVGPGYQTVGASTIQTLALLVFMGRTLPTAWLLTLLAFPSLFFGFFLAYAGSFVTKVVASPFESPSVWLMLPLSFCFALEMMLVVLVDRQIFLLFRRCSWIRVFASFPVLWTAAWWLCYHLSLYGDFGGWHSALSAVGLESLLVGSTWLFGAVSGGNYVHALIATLLADVVICHFFERSPPCDSSNSQKAKKIDVNEANPWRIELKLKSVHLLALALLGFIAVLGSSLETFLRFPGSFYQRPIQMYAPKTLQASCLIRGTLASTEAHLNEQGGSRSQLVLWSEASLLVHDEKDLLDRARNLSATFDVYLGLAYYLDIKDDNQRQPSVGATQKYRYQNKFALIAPHVVSNKTTASVAWVYQKTHPVPHVEDNVQPGSGSIPFVDTPFGRVASSICFDFNFPNLNKVAAQDVDIVLQPSSTWGPNAAFHAYVNRLRAVENGFMQVRCSRYGFSGVYDAFHRVVAEKITLNKETFVFHIPLRRRLWTFFGFTGDILGQFSLVLTVYWLYLLVRAFTSG